MAEQIFLAQTGSVCCLHRKDQSLLLLMAPHTLSPYNWAGGGQTAAPLPRAFLADLRHQRYMQYLHSLWEATPWGVMAGEDATQKWEKSSLILIPWGNSRV
uniref:Uncharacterized protein n=1 Tax=Prolemur simus TaxID=1328070 RepID=A0A8C8Z2P7_PROSS